MTVLLPRFRGATWQILKKKQKFNNYHNFFHDAIISGITKLIKPLCMAIPIHIRIFDSLSMFFLVEITFLELGTIVYPQKTTGFTAIYMNMGFFVKNYFVTCNI